MATPPEAIICLKNNYPPKLIEDVGRQKCPFRNHHHILQQLREQGNIYTRFLK